MIHYDSFRSHLETSRIKTPLTCALAGGLIGYYYQLHRVFLRGTTEQIAIRTAGGFLVAAMLSLLLYCCTMTFASSGVRRILKRAGLGVACAASYALLVYATYILIANTRVIVSSGGTLPTLLLVFPAFFLASLLIARLSRFALRMSFATASMAIWVLLVAYILIRTGSAVGVGITALYYLYLVLLGRFTAGGVGHLLRLDFDSSLETFVISAVFGVLSNYLLWYCLGMSGLLHSATAYSAISCVLLAGLLRYGRSILRNAGCALSASRAVLKNKPSVASSVLLNVTLCCLLFLVALLTVRFPGTSDSSARMYCATVFKFAEMHRIVFMPFYQHWPLIFQPLLVEVTGLPPYLMGGIAALRFFHGTVYFSFVPFIVLLCRKYDLSYRTLVVLLLIVVSSSFSFRIAYFDKPGVVALPAFIALLVICLIMLQDVKPWYVLLVGALTAVIYNSKLILMQGAIVSIIALCAYHLVHGKRALPRRHWRPVVASMAIFVTVCSLHAIQNTYLRGNPVHPFVAQVFSRSHDFPEEVAFTKIPGTFYERTMPTQVPSRIFAINLDRAEGMYQPLLLANTTRGNRSPAVTGKSVTIALPLATLLLPFLLLVRSDRITVFCTVVAGLALFVWFGWIGDSWRYSTFFPSIALLIAALVSRPVVANRILDLSWRYAFYGLLVLSVPMALNFTARDPTTGRLFDYLLERSEDRHFLDPALPEVTGYLRAQRDAKPVLLVVGMEPVQYGFFQPNFQYQPIRWRQDYFTNMVYISEIRPTHLLATRPLDRNILIRNYPFLKQHLRLATRFGEPPNRRWLYKFDEHTPWEELQAKYEKVETYVPGYLKDIRRVLAPYRS